MSVQRKPQNRQSLATGANPRSRPRDPSSWTPQQQYEHYVETRIDPRTRKGLMQLEIDGVPILRPGLKFNLTNREREKRGLPKIVLRCFPKKKE